MNFPEYKRINDEYEVAFLLENLSVQVIEESLKMLLEDEALYFRLKQHCNKAREEYNWQNEEKKLIDFYFSTINLFTFTFSPVFRKTI